MNLKPYGITRTRPPDFHGPKNLDEREFLEMTGRDLFGMSLTSLYVALDEETRHLAIYERIARRTGRGLDASGEPREDQFCHVRRRWVLDEIRSRRGNGTPRGSTPKPHTSKYSTPEILPL